MFSEVRKKHNCLDILINNAGMASMNHFLLTPVRTVHQVINTNLVGTFLFCREAAKLMKKNKYGRIINFTTVAVPLKLEGEAIYASSKAAVMSLTGILAKELAEFGITVNAVGPTPTKTDLIRSVPQEKLDALLRQQAIHRFGEFRDIINVIDFFIRPESDFVTGQVIFFGWCVVFIDFLLETFERNKEKDAIIWKDGVYSYKWLLGAVEKWRKKISTKKISSGTVTILETDFSPNSVALFMALIEHGCILVPLTSSVETKKTRFH